MSLTEEDKKRVLEKNATIKLDTVFQIIKCLDVASNRGAFRGNELSFVGSVYDTINNGLTKAFEDELNKKSKTVGLKPIIETE